MKKYKKIILLVYCFVILFYCTPHFTFGQEKLDSTFIEKRVEAFIQDYFLQLNLLGQPMLVERYEDPVHSFFTSPNVQVTNDLFFDESIYYKSSDYFH